MSKLKMLKPRLAELKDDRVKTIGSDSWRDGKETAAQRGYGGRWQKARATYLRANPLCVMCKAETPSRVTLATVVDHKIPHRGSPDKFWNTDNWQSLCQTHHSSDKQREERSGKPRRVIGADGWPE